MKRNEIESLLVLEVCRFPDRETFQNLREQLDSTEDVVTSPGASNRIIPVGFANGFASWE